MNVSSEEIAKIYYNKIWKLYRIPRIILSNRGICINIYRRSYESIGNKTNAINSISLSNRWTNKANQPRN